MSSYLHAYCQFENDLWPCAARERHRTRCVSGFIAPTSACGAADGGTERLTGGTDSGMHHHLYSVCSVCSVCSARRFPFNRWDGGCCLLWMWFIQSLRTTVEPALPRLPSTTQRNKQTNKQTNKQNKTKQNKTKQNKTKQNKTKTKQTNKQTKQLNKRNSLPLGLIFACAPVLPL